MGTNEKRDQNARAIRTWCIWQDLLLAYNDYDGNICRDSRYIKRSDYEPRFTMADRIVNTDQEYIDAVMCIGTATPGSHPRDILPWLIVEPPTPNFRSTDLAKEIGYRWTLDSEEWLKQNEILLDRQEVKNLERSAVTFIEMETIRVPDPSVKSNYVDSIEKELSEFLPEKPEDSTLTSKEFDYNDVLVTKFSDTHLGQRQVHHHDYYRLIICDEYPSNCFSDTSDLNPTSKKNYFDS